MHKLLITLMVIPLFGSCSNKYGGSTTDDLAEMAFPMAGAGVGAALAGDDTKDKVLGGVLGGAGGYLLGKLALGDDKQAKAYQAGLEAGYVKGSSDSVKRDYWSLQRNQNGMSEAGSLTIREYEIPAFASDDGKVYMPRKIKVPVTE